MQRFTGIQHLETALVETRFTRCKGEIRIHFCVNQLLAQVPVRLFPDQEQKDIVSFKKYNIFKTVFSAL